MSEAVTLTAINLMLLFVFLKQRKKPRFKLPATVCVLSSAVGTSLAWLAYVIDMYQKEAFHLTLKLKLITLSIFFILFPLILFGDWFVYYILNIFKQKPHEPRILFHIGKIGISYVEIIKAIMLLSYGYYFLRIILMKEPLI